VSASETVRPLSELVRGQQQQQHGRLAGIFWLFFSFISKVKALLKR